MDVAAMTLDAYLDAWLALLRTRVQPTTFRSYDDMLAAPDPQATAAIGRARGGSSPPTSALFELDVVQPLHLD